MLLLVGPLDCSEVNSIVAPFSQAFVSGANFPVSSNSLSVIFLAAVGFEASIVSSGKAYTVFINPVFSNNSTFAQDVPRSVAHIDITSATASKLNEYFQTTHR